MNRSGIKYLLTEGFRNIKANRQMTIASVGVLMACMLLIGAAVLLTLNINSLMGYVEDQNEVVAFVDWDASDSTISSVESAINSIENIDQVVYVSREDALLEQMAELGEDASILEGLLEDNPMPPSYRIKVKDLELLTDTRDQLAAIPGVYKVNATTDVVSILLDISKGVNTAGMIIVIILAAVSVIIVSNTVKVTIFNRRKEINIMKYVGATDMFIRTPFLVEGIVIGLMSALLSFGLLWVGYEYVTHWLSQSASSWLLIFHENMIPFTEIALPILGGFAGAGAFFGMSGTLFFVGKYLKV